MMFVFFFEEVGKWKGEINQVEAVVDAFRCHTLPQTDFRDPRQVLFLLKDAFLAEQNNNMFFAICYGAYNTSSD
jgi:serine phosphatase RsbU (regulator of sigma subunit)